MTNELSTELTGSIALLNEELQNEAVGYNTQLVVAKINHQEGTFSIPSLPSVPRLEVVILASRRARAFYPEFGNKQIKELVLGLTNKRPVCSSTNYTQGNLADIDWEKLPVDSPMRNIKDQIAKGGLECAQCPLNKWGSVELLGNSGRGKACKESRRLLLWRQGGVIPIMLKLSTSSIKAWDGYCSSLEAVSSAHNLKVTEISLEKRESYGEVFHAANFAVADDMTEGMAAELLTDKMTEDGMKKLHRHLVDVFIGREIGSDEYEDAGNGIPVESSDDEL